MRKGLVIFGIELTTDQLIFYGLLFLMGLIMSIASAYLYFKVQNFMHFLNQTGLASLLMG